VIPRFAAACVSDRLVDVRVSQGFVSRRSGRFLTAFHRAGLLSFSETSHGGRSARGLVHVLADVRRVPWKKRKEAA
jgi:hypothetical protein